MNITSSPGSADEVLVDAVADHESIVALTQQLVQIPSQAGIDSYEPILEYLEDWLSEHGLAPRRLQTANPDGSRSDTVALACDLVGAHPGPHYVLDACVDTAPFGDVDAWQYLPTSGLVKSGWLYGRGSADSKAGAAIFAHIATRLGRQTPQLHGSLTLLLDADEHTGQFGGAKRYFGGPDAPRDVIGVMIGYPGLDKVVIGGRGFLRAQLTLYGEADHSGSSRSTEISNAVERAAAWVEELTQQRRRRMPGADRTFGPPPKLTVTAIHGGQGYSILPDRCTVNVDVRLTPTFDRQAAVDLLEEAAKQFDLRWPVSRPTRLEYLESWPPYRLSKRLPLCAALTAAATSYLPSAPRMKVAGPSNIGNYLAQLGVPATAGFGVVYRGLHGTDESIKVDSIPVVQAVYQRTVLSLLNGR
jgi:succinyl-diaminopimelate desuccinylase